MQEKSNEYFKVALEKHNLDQIEIWVSLLLEDFF